MKTLYQKIEHTLEILQSIQDSVDQILEEIQMENRLITSVPTVDDYIEYNLFDDLYSMVYDTNRTIDDEQLKQLKNFIHDHVLAIRTVLLDGIVQYQQYDNQYKSLELE